MRAFDSSCNSNVGSVHTVERMQLNAKSRSSNRVLRERDCMADGCRCNGWIDDFHIPWLCDDGCNGVQSFHLHAGFFSAGGRSDISVSWAFEVELQQIDLVV